MDLLKLICLSVIAKLVGFKWGDEIMNHCALGRIHLMGIVKSYTGKGRAL